MTDPVEKWVCDPSIEYCATADVFPADPAPAPIDATPLILIGSVFVFDLLAPIIWYFVRMPIRYLDTATYFSTNAVDIAANILWIVNLVIFLVGFALWPFHWLGEESVDWILAYMMVNFYSDAVPALTLVFFLIFLFVAFFSESQTAQICETVNLTQICYYNPNYISAVDGWLTWALFTVFSAASYFVFFWFGADAVRYLRPNGGYDLYYMFPTIIYELLVVVGVAPDAYREVNGYDEVFGVPQAADHHDDDHAHDDATSTPAAADEPAPVIDEPDNSTQDDSSSTADADTAAVDDSSSFLAAF